MDSTNSTFVNEPEEKSSSPSYEPGPYDGIGIDALAVGGASRNYRTDSYREASLMPPLEPQSDMSEAESEHHSLSSSNNGANESDSGESDRNEGQIPTRSAPPRPRRASVKEGVELSPGQPLSPRRLNSEDEAKEWFLLAAVRMQPIPLAAFILLVILIPMNIAAISSPSMFILTGEYVDTIARLRSVDMSGGVGVWDWELVETGSGVDGQSVNTKLFGDSCDAEWGLLELDISGRWIVPSYTAASTDCEDTLSNKCWTSKGFSIIGLFFQLVAVFLLFGKLARNLPTSVCNVPMWLYRGVSFVSPPLWVAGMFILLSSLSDLVIWSIALDIHESDASRDSDCGINGLSTGGTGVETYTVGFAFGMYVTMFIVKMILGIVTVLPINKRFFDTTSV